MKKSGSFASILALLALVTLSGASFAHAQSQAGWTSNGWVSGVSIQDMTGNSALAQNQALLAGHAYNLTLQINVPSTLTNTLFDVSVNNFFGAAPGQSVFWVVHNPSYPGYNRTAFIAGRETVSLSYDLGTVKMSTYFQVPLNFTNPVAHYSSPSGNGTVSLHLPQTVIFVSVVPHGGTPTGYFSGTVQDQTIQTYSTGYNQATALVPTGKIPSTYESLINSILAQAQAISKLGLPDNGTALLNTLVPSAFPTPPSNSLQTYLIVGLGVAVILVIVLALTMLRSRGKSGYSVGIINEVQKDLAVLEVTAAKYDRAMADKLKSLRDKLGESS